MRRALIGCVMLLCAQQGVQAQEIGRLFTSEAERAALERGRHAKPGARIQARDTPAPVAAPLPVEGEQILVVNGVVRRSGSGRETTWIDAVPHSGNARLAGGAALAPGRSASRVGLTLRSGKVISVKPGQNIDAATGKVREGYLIVAPKPRPVADAVE
jgi:hypothetical protein